MVKRRKIKRADYEGYETVRSSTARVSILPYEVGTVKYVELFGEISEIGANAEAPIISWDVPKGHCAEVFSLGVIPDYDPSTDTSNLQGVFLAVTGKMFPHSNFSANHIGRNFVPFGTRASKQPMLLLDVPLRRGSLTYKFSEGETIQLYGKAGASAVSLPVRARLGVLLLEEEDVRAIYGVGITEFAKLEGGHLQEKPVLIFAEYYDNSATAGAGKWESVAKVKVESYEQIQLRKIGVAPHDNADSLKLVDTRTKKEFPEYEPYWKVNSLYNMLPFGDDDDYQPAPELPLVIKRYVWTNTDIDIKIRDTGASIPDAGVRVQLLGVYRRVG